MQCQLYTETEDLWLEKTINSVYRGDLLLLPISSRPSKEAIRNVLTTEKSLVTVFIPKIHMINTTDI
jgi:hypothetical protein